MKRRLLASILALALAAAGALALTGAASAGGNKGETTVTIQEQNGDFHGTVRSNRPNKCAEDRLIWVYKQKGREQRPSRDNRLYMDTASLSGGRYEWDTGNTSANDGKYYARATPTPDCKADNSRTVRVT
ncbi:MAG: hypothetical protein WEA10_07925 [Actinomycetota bacterium]